jgi:hypothetical protein
MLWRTATRFDARKCARAPLPRLGWPAAPSRGIFHRPPEVLHLQRLLFAKAIGDDLQSVAPPAAAPAPKFQCRIVPPPNCDVRKR